MISMETNPETNKTKKAQVPLSERYLLTLEEASIYTGLGQSKLRQISNSEDCRFVLWNGSKRMFKRKQLENYLETTYSI